MKGLTEYERMKLEIVVADADFTFEENDPEIVQLVERGLVREVQLEDDPDNWGLEATQMGRLIFQVTGPNFGHV